MTVYPRFRQRYAAHPRIAHDLNRADPGAFYAGACSLVETVQDPSLMNRFIALSCRKALIYGQRNRHLEELSGLPDDWKIEIPNAGHFAMDDNPAIFFDRLASLLTPEH